jgi:hypothetical protein
MSITTSLAWVKCPEIDHGTAATDHPGASVGMRVPSGSSSSISQKRSASITIRNLDEKLKEQLLQ